MQDERPRLRAAEAAMEGDQLLERATLLELRVVEATDHDVRHVLETVRAQQMGRSIRGERRERIVALDATVNEVVSASGIDGQRTLLGRVNEQPADMRMSAERRDQARMALLDLLGGQAPLLLHQIDQAEVARAEHHRTVLTQVVVSPETSSDSWPPEELGRPRPRARLRPPSPRPFRPPAIAGRAGRGRSRFAA